MVFKGTEQQTKQGNNDGWVENLRGVGKLTRKGKMADDIGEYKTKNAGNDA
jgi:hypothetical protein